MAIVPTYLGFVLTQSVLVWLIIAIVMLIIEAVTTLLISIWFVAGAAVAAIVALFVPQIWLQILVFILVSAVLLGLTIKKRKQFMMQYHKTPTNADRLIGQVGVLSETIDPILGTGAITIQQQCWSARSVDGKTIPQGQMVIVREISGVKLLVEPYTPPNASISD